MKRKFPDSFYNYTTFVGVAISIISFGIVLFLIVLDFLASEHKPYMGIITFVVLPTILIFGLILIAIGAIRQRKKIKSGQVIKLHLPKVDLNEPKQFTAFLVFSVGTILLIMFSAFGSYKAYEYTDSDEFCGEVCHKVMQPEFTAYQNSPHARVGCAKCHIGPGADWFVKAKITGAYQVYSVLFNKYSKPIPTPIENLRPAQETCEQCHWPKHFYSQKIRTFNYFLGDEKNTKFELIMAMKIGGGNSESGINSGIHWHMNVANEVEYKAIDNKRQIIPWVKVKYSNGKSRIYKSQTNENKINNLATIESRSMDCVDCHNRPTHIYNTPSRIVNEFISIDRIDKNLPFIKNISVTILETEFENNKNAFDSIKILIENYYKENYPEVLKSKKENLNQAIESIKKIYSRNYFPEMKVSWKSFPNNIGHMYAKGCFRCHDGEHVSDDGKKISKDCNVCHKILSQKFENNKIFTSVSGIDYRHPVEIGKEWNEINCINCHLKSAK